jgi:major membrane immunogen (membrane-anchored lipoprotein)
VLATVQALEAQLDAERVEVVSGIARSLQDFRDTDPRFLHATGP